MADDKKKEEEKAKQKKTKAIACTALLHNKKIVFNDGDEVSIDKLKGMGINVDRLIKGGGIKIVEG